MAGGEAADGALRSRLRVKAHLEVLGRLLVVYQITNAGACQANPGNPVIDGPLSLEVAGFSRVVNKIIEGFGIGHRIPVGG